MSSIQKTAKGYRAQVAIKGVRDSATFRTKREAEAWAAARESEIRADMGKPAAGRHTLRELLERYRDEESPKRRGERWEIIRINRFLRAYPDVAAMRLCDLSSATFGAWRDARLREVSSGSVLREMGQLHAAFEVARSEWGWIQANPLADVRNPSAPHHREVTITWRQIKRMLCALGYSRRERVTQVRHVVAVCFLLALRTGMRASELCLLSWDRVYSDYVVLRQTKTVPRNVPLSAKAVALIERMRGWDEEFVFALKPQSLDAMFRKYRESAGLSGFTFHDSRHTAATWMARRIDVLDLCKAFGWSDPKRAMIYYNPTASDIARRLNP